MRHSARAGMSLYGLTGERKYLNAAERRRFIAGYVPNGAYMPNGVDGSWNFGEALQPLVGRRSLALEPFRKPRPIASCLTTGVAVEPRHLRAK